MAARARTSGADAVFLDLEDAVAPQDKAVARDAVRATLAEDDWSATSPGLRVNDLASEWADADLDLLAEVASRVDFVVVPKVTTPDDVRRVAARLDDVEGGYVEGGTQIEVLVETAASLVDLPAVLAASPRVTALTLGTGDLAASLGTRIRLLAEELPPGGLDFWHPARVLVLAAARAAGIAAFDGPYGNFKDEAGFARKCRLAAGLGFDGIWVIHPSQIEVAHRSFAYTDDEIAWARSVVDALADSGAAYVPGQGMVDAVTAGRARRILAAVEGDGR
jgi:citrate lyase subunit beta/citryl-CoA lyase